MALTKSFIPYGGYWSSAFCRWQGSLANENSLVLAAKTAKTFLASREIQPERLDSVALGHTVPQKHSFYGAPWVAGMLGAAGATGPTIGQACATPVSTLASAATAVETGMHACNLTITCDRTSNGPHMVYPNPKGIGGAGTTEDPVWDNFNLDPYAGNAMIDTAENVAREAGISRELLDEITLLRYRQYEESLADDRAFQRRYLVPVEIGKGRRATTIDADEGIHPTTEEGLAKLEPVSEGGVVTFGTQTHPADGNAGMFVCDRDTAASLSKDAKIQIQVLGFGSARVKKGFMPMAVVPAARQALEHAGVAIGDCRAIKTHNPFAINDAYMCRELDLAPDKINRYGSSLIYGHPQGPTGMRAIAELIEELALAGGGHGLFTGCAAGDTAMALVLRVGDAS
jgi:acetyl-CoA acetyltransferase